MPGPLDGLRIIEFAGLGPGPFACMMLADHGAEVIRIERPGGTQGGPESDASTDILLRSRKRIAIDMKTDSGKAVLRDLIATADGLIEGFRPGVMERLGLGPDDMLNLNPKLVYGRMTGWGQTGPYAQMAGHDINYIALSGALHAFGRKGEKPTPPINMMGDFGGGAMMLAFGMVSALLHVQRGGTGTVIDAAMTDGSALLMSMIYSFHGQRWWKDERGVNMLDTGAHFYDVYETRDGKFISLGPIEPQFYAKMLELTGLAGDPDMVAQNDPQKWDDMRDKLAKVIAAKTRDEWDGIMVGSDACYAPILSLTEAPDHPHNRSRDTFVTAGGVRQPTPAPRYSSIETTPPEMSNGQTHTRELLAGLGYTDEQIETTLSLGGVS
ncbi:CaiB/BaiF CoA transferase family protein [uncultured Sulfitobacter sp.]|jgi:alpha-methylacyl-CoA racemase|uniref:CaiB/BaiF CoA transferase family protein n=1 Tax=Sulfitobacter sp. SH22 TaxID=3421172 RepID=UPI001B5D1C0F|nr:CaiB/BaiF CoA-transferase family protein [uncultured Sulfitobacter sp.]MBQ0805498.1 CoA transferase [Sulfitobacter sp.]